MAVVCKWGPVAPALRALTLEDVRAAMQQVGPSAGVPLAQHVRRHRARVRAQAVERGLRRGRQAQAGRAAVLNVKAAGWWEAQGGGHRQLGNADTGYGGCISRSGRGPNRTLLHLLVDKYAHLVVYVDEYYTSQVCASNVWTASARAVTPTLRRTCGTR
ncbi:hypothetical protein CHLRE_10g433866v5 [Chlamydomonas reinhardtii]|uniref:Uncharacterized protein n=1 Tax=Chlamydomonas reinhardtii TaxID=3055 RepID=A0A2K3DA20_CHLRE|nr:uncharacterized protein CHLRE_10g433866v5 [Chlamydomonas reinhardtii]PNW77375.1 hypothetical protein CHLRE_10g433866v5 [Chlamydomonas reinhardtii]